MYIHYIHEGWERQNHLLGGWALIFRRLVHLRYWNLASFQSLAYTAYLYSQLCRQGQTGGRHCCRGEIWSCWWPVQWTPPDAHSEACWVLWWCEGSPGQHLWSGVSALLQALATHEALPLPHPKNGFTLFINRVRTYNTEWYNVNSLVAHSSGDQQCPEYACPSYLSPWPGSPQKPGMKNGLTYILKQLLQDMHIHTSLVPRPPLNYSSVRIKWKWEQRKTGKVLWGGCEIDIKVRGLAANNTLDLHCWSGHQTFVWSKLLVFTGKKLAFKISACNLNMYPFPSHPQCIHSCYEWPPCFSSLFCFCVSLWVQTEE